MEPTHQQAIPVTAFAEFLTAGVDSPMAIPAGYDFLVTTILFQPLDPGSTQLWVADSSGIYYVVLEANFSDPGYGQKPGYPIEVTLPGGVSYNVRSTGVNARCTLAGWYVSPTGATIL